MRSAEKPLPEQSNVITQYETLRRAALGSALPPEARAGLLLFLRRGMWGWALAVTRGSLGQPSTSLRPADRQAPQEDRTVIYILAALAIQSSHPGAIS